MIDKVSTTAHQTKPNSQLGRKGKMNIIDMAQTPDYNPVTNKNRGNWSLHDVSTKQVYLDSTWNKPNCIEHGAMNCVSQDLAIWRCLTCARSCVDLDKINTKKYIAPKQKV